MEPLSVVIRTPIPELLNAKRGHRIWESIWLDKTSEIIIIIIQPVTQHHHGHIQGRWIHLKTTTALPIKTQ